MLRTISVFKLAFGLLALATPTLVLLPLGIAYLWQQNWLIHYVAASFGLSALAYFLLGVAGGTAAEASPELIESSNAASSIIERRARNASPEIFSSQQALTNEIVATVTDVAHAFHAETNDPVLQFTVPEALQLLERTSARLRPLVAERIPLGSRLTVGQMVELYRWRTVVDTAGKVWNVWRVLRIMNPAAAATNEARERLGRDLLAFGKRTVFRQLAELVVREVGNAAADLYSGKLKSSQSEPGSAATEAEL